MRVAGKRAGKGRVILAHLETERAWLPFTKARVLIQVWDFTPAGGMIMGTRPGDLDRV